MLKPADLHTLHIPIDCPDVDVPDSVSGPMAEKIAEAIDNEIISHFTMMRFIWHHCSMCGWCIMCPQCGNNCCNGAYGELNEYITGKDGYPERSHTIKCEICKLAYQYQELGWKSNLHPPDININDRDSYDCTCEWCTKWSTDSWFYIDCQKRKVILDERKKKQ